MRGPDARARARAFPDTSWVVIRDARDARSPTRQASIARLVELYRAPVDAYLRRRWQLGASDAEDLTQEFFRSLLARDLLARVAPDRGRFRAFVKTVVDNLHRRPQPGAQLPQGRPHLSRNHDGRRPMRRP
jgi:RNA polymerase sigma-70 factor (ECF subfamily)